MSSSRSPSGTTISSPPAGRLESALGYRFNRGQLLEQALTHKSFTKPDNERLEFLGDAVLGQVVAHRLYELLPDAAEAELSLLRASLVRRETLAELAATLELGRYLRLGAGELRSGGHRRASILADALEAIIGAVRLDGGMEAAAALVLRLLESRLGTLDVEAVKDAKTRLQEWLQGAGHPLPEYTIRSATGAAHARTFTVGCRVAAFDLEVTGEGRSRRAAEQHAAEQMLSRLRAPTGETR